MRIEEHWESVFENCNALISAAGDRKYLKDNEIADWCDEIREAIYYKLQGNGITWEQVETILRSILGAYEWLAMDKEERERRINMTRVWRVFNKTTGETCREFSTDRNITLDEAIEIAGFEPYEGEKEQPDDPDYFRVVTDEPCGNGTGVQEVWYDDLDYELVEK